MSKLMDFGFAVFNNNRNNADKKVRAMMRITSPKLLERLEKIEAEEGGIMGIFNVPPEAATMLYAGAIYALVNDDVYRHWG